MSKTPPHNQPAAPTDEAFSRVFDAASFIHGGGVAIFHLATARVVLCYYPRGDHWFLPKGRRDAGEEAREAAEREGFEESGYRNRLLPLPVRHRQPAAYNPSSTSHSSRYVREPVYHNLSPFGRRLPHLNMQYLVSYYIAETLPPALEESVAQTAATTATPDNPTPYVAPEPFPDGKDFTLADRVAMESEGYEPVKHLRTGVDADELTYESHLLPVEEACERVKGTLHEDVIREGWRLIERRRMMEGGKELTGAGVGAGGAVAAGVAGQGA